MRLRSRDTLARLAGMSVSEGACTGVRRRPHRSLASNTSSRARLCRRRAPGSAPSCASVAQPGDREHAQRRRLVVRRCTSSSDPQLSNARGGESSATALTAPGAAALGHQQPHARCQPRLPLRRHRSTQPTALPNGGPEGEVGGPGSRLCEDSGSCGIVHGRSTRLGAGCERSLGQTSTA
jgi:hypothetical protein